MYTLHSKRGEIMGIRITLGQIRCALENYQLTRQVRRPGGRFDIGQAPLVDALNKFLRPLANLSHDTILNEHQLFEFTPILFISRNVSRSLLNELRSLFRLFEADDRDQSNIPLFLMVAWRLHDIELLNQERFRKLLALYENYQGGGEVFFTLFIKVHTIFTLLEVSVDCQEYEWVVNLTLDSAQHVAKIVFIVPSMSFTVDNLRKLLQRDITFHAALVPVIQWLDDSRILFNHNIDCLMNLPQHQYQRIHADLDSKPKSQDSFNQAIDKAKDRIAFIDFAAHQRHTEKTIRDEKISLESSTDPLRHLMPEAGADHHYLLREIGTFVMPASVPEKYLHEENEKNDDDKKMTKTT